jgi:hypothetical protein
MIRKTLNYISTYILVGIFACLTIISFAQKTTSVQGKVKDAKTKETMAYVNVQFEGTSIGATSDIEGNFYIETRENLSRLQISYVGYKSQTITIKTGEVNRLEILLNDATNELQEVVIGVGKYRNKGNPAVDLIKKVLENKDNNRKEGFDYYSYQKYEKVDFAINNVTEKMRNNLLFRNMKFVFDHVDTNKASSKLNLPFFLRESISDLYYRKKPKASKEYLLAERNSNINNILDDEGINNYISDMYQDVSFYNNSVNLLTVQFISPLSPIGPTIYRYYIQDTVVLKGTSCAHIYFAPRNKTDLAFMGHLWVALDSSYAVRKIEAGIPKDINLNWVNEMQISQEYDFVTTPQYDSLHERKKGLVLVKDVIFIDFGIFKGDSTRSVLGTKTTSYKNYVLGEKIEDKLLDVPNKVFITDNAFNKTEDFWTANRHDTLSKKEQGIIKTVDSLNNYKPFKRFANALQFFISDYVGTGPLSFGPINSIYSFNAIEGSRVRWGGRTNALFNRHLMFDGYGAYGFNDKKWKGSFGALYNFTNNKYFDFPVSQLKAWYQYDVKIPGQEFAYAQTDNVLLSFSRGVTNKMLYTETMGVEYAHEFPNRFSYTLSAKHKSQSAAGVLLFDYDKQGDIVIKHALKTTEIGVSLRYAPNEKFYQGATYRRIILTRFPVFQLTYTKGFKDMMDGEYDYHQINFKVKKTFYLSPIGYSIVSVEAGRTIGTVPYPLLTVHRANQTYIYQLESYSLMNYFEFVSDKYASINMSHNFGGVIFGRLPLIKKLDWREVITFKALWGGMDAHNMPTSQNGLLKLPSDEITKQPLTYTLNSQPYLEASVGIGNIFKVLRVDYVRRLSYLDNPNVTKSGLRFRLRVEY